MKFQASETKFNNVLDSVITTASCYCLLLRHLVKEYHFFSNAGLLLQMFAVWTFFLLEIVFSRIIFILLIILSSKEEMCFSSSFSLSVTF